jgi:16S rRNA (uracil1498-N3)-methyltransferase
MHRFFVEPGEMAGDRFPLPEAIVHQVTRVLRLRDRAQVMLLDGLGEAVVCRLEQGECLVDSRGPAGGEPRHRLTIWQALLRGDHLEPVIRHGTEIGISRFHPLVTERCVVRDLSSARLDRLRTVAREAAEQSERGTIPPIDAPIPFAEALAATESGSVLLFEREAGTRLTEMEPPPSLFIGPEGGFTTDEVAAAQQAGLAIAGLGPRILRSESVALAAAAAILSRTGDFA